MKHIKVNLQKVFSTTCMVGLIALLLVLVSSCEEEKVGQHPLHNNPPPGLSNVQAEPLPGGALISYDLPNATDISYVECEYFFKEDKKIIRESIYSNSLIIEGLPDIIPCEFTLYLVDHSENRSEPLKGSFIPLEPPYLAVAKTITMEPDFGGVVIRWQNETNAMIGAFLMARDENGEWIESDLVFSTIEDERRSIRGYNTDERDFAVVLTDRFGNTSDTVITRATPLFEKELDKRNFRNAALLGDNYTTHTGGRTIEKIWDGSIATSDIWHSNPAAGIIPPQTFTIDLGVEAQLSRLMLWNRQGEFIFSQHNVRFFEIWGAKELSHDRNNSYWRGEEWKDEWTLLGDFEQIKPSGLPLGQHNADDIAATEAGGEYVFTPGAGDIRYIRFVVKETWARTGVLHIAEITVYGDDGIVENEEGGE